MGVIEPALVAPTFARPAEMIGGKHFGRTASFCLEREKSVPGPNVEDAFASDRLVENQVRFAPKRFERLDALDLLAIGKCEGVKPAIGQGGVTSATTSRTVPGTLNKDGLPSRVCAPRQSIDYLWQ
jgi:hypothetical protein